ncbi:MAG: hypothetical protein FWF54_07715 [Candidatus Azobacteroides sp.]|nr:hypothetical protein [Candidatus Azobacteroides sp.]
MKQYEVLKFIKISTILLLCFFISCSTKHVVNTTGARIVSDVQNVMYYTNDIYNFYTEINTIQDNNLIDTVVDKRKNRILHLADFNNRRDTILFAGKSDIIVLKKQVKDLSKFRVINLSDTILSKYPFDYWKVNFYRQIIIDKKHKTYIINDIIPYKNRFLQIIRFNETDYNAEVDPTDLNDIVSYYYFYKETIPQTKETYISILENKKPAVPDIFELLNNLFTNDSLFNYHTAYLVQSKEYNYNTPANIGIFKQMLATYYSFADDAVKSDSVWRQWSNRKDTCNCAETGTISDLMKTISQNQIVMFNEAHHIPMHRLLLENLLDTLYMQGFRYLALESFANDSLFDKTGYISGDNGIYLREPTFANLVRKAYSLGFKVFGYDAMTANRENVQAQNIYDQTIKQDSTAKTVVLAGWGHIDKNAMTGEFEKISGVKPLTIDQTVGYNFCDKNNAPDVPYLFKPSADMLGVKVDLYLCNNLRLLSENKNMLNIPEEIRAVCKTVCFYKQNEFDFLRSQNKIPLPVAVISTNDNASVSFNLKKGDYVVIFQDSFGYILKKYQLTVEK